MKKLEEMFTLKGFNPSITLNKSEVKMDLVLVYMRKRDLLFLLLY